MNKTPIKLKISDDSNLLLPEFLEDIQDEKLRLILTKLNNEVPDGVEKPIVDLIPTINEIVENKKVTVTLLESNKVAKVNEIITAIQEAPEELPVNREKVIDDITKEVEAENQRLEEERQKQDAELLKKQKEEFEKINRAEISEPINQ